MLTIHPKNPYFLVIIIVLYMMMAAPATTAEETAVAVVVSQKIRPYVQVTDGILDQVPQNIKGPDVFFLFPGDESVTVQVFDRLVNGSYDLVAAVGPEAAALVWKTGIPGKKMYVALLDPDTVSHLPDDACGISLRIPVPVQVETITTVFPSLRKIGLLFDPNHNQRFFDAATAAAINRPVAPAIIAMPVTERNQISPVLKDHLGDVDAVWMIPDPTVISEKLIQYVVKQALYADTGVIGYNAYFTRVGAFFSFEFDYQKLGRQAGDVIIDSLAGKNCLHLDPVFDTRINNKIVDRLGLIKEETP